MIDDDELRASLRHERRARPVEEVMRAGRRRRQQRQRMGGFAAAVAVGAVALVTVRAVDDSAEPDDTVVAGIGQGVLEQVAVSRQFGSNAPLAGLAVGPDGSLWAAWTGQGIYRFDDEMQVTLAVEDIDLGVYSSGIAITDDGALLGVGWSPSPERDAHGDPLALKTVSRIHLDGTVTTLAQLGDPVQAVIGSDPPLLVQDALYVRVDRQVWSVSLTGEPEGASRPADDTIRSMNLGADSLLVATGQSVVELDPGDLQTLRTTARPGANEAVSVGEAIWVLDDDGGPAERLDGSAVTASSDVGEPLALDASDAVLWAYARDGIAVHDPSTGEVLASTPGQWFGTFLAHGDVAWVQDDLGGGVLRRFELRDSTVAPNERTSPGSIELLAGPLGCDSTVPSVVDPPDGPTPSEAYDCTIGDYHLSLFVYRDRAEAAQAYAGLAERCAPALSDNNWIVWTNANEAATNAHRELGGDLSLVRDPC